MPEVGLIGRTAHSAFCLAMLFMLAVAFGGSVNAQPYDLPIVPATTDKYPPGVKVASLPGGSIYVNKAGQTLYGMDMRTVLRAGPDPAQYCSGSCAELWEPLLAPPGSQANIKFPRGNSNTGLPSGFVAPQTAPDWTVIDGVSGPQWLYKGWHMVFVRKGERRGSIDFDGADNLTWNTLKFVPPVPVITAPSNVRAAFIDGQYVLTDDKGRLLFTGKCNTQCADWQPFAGGMASAGVGKWRINVQGDLPQWQYGPSPVFVAADAKNLPRDGKLLRP